MEISKMINAINEKLAGETLMYSQLVNMIDCVIDDMNTSLNSTYPVLSEFTSDKYSDYPNYSCFPDRYIRTVLIPGVAAKFYSIDEEGAEVAPMFDREYKQGLYHMVRDFSLYIPDEFQNKCVGYVQDGCNCSELPVWGIFNKM